MLETISSSVTIPRAECGSAPCGPECRFAVPLASGASGDYVWCRLHGAPRSTTARVDCPWFSPMARATHDGADPG